MAPIHTLISGSTVAENFQGRGYKLDSTRERELESEHNELLIKTEFFANKCSDFRNAKVLAETRSDELAKELKSKNEKILQGLIQELTSNFPEIDTNNGEIEISKSCIQDMVPGSTQCLSDLFDKAIKLGQKQILCWYNYSFEFENKVKSLTTDSKIKDKTARSQIYKEMKPFLPNITDVNLHKKTERARKILKLFGEGGICINKIKYITYSASTISGLKDTQIQYIISQVNSKTVANKNDQTSGSNYLSKVEASGKTTLRVSDSLVTSSNTSRRLYFVDGRDSTFSNLMAFIGANPHFEDPGALIRRVG
ncbi:10706_t:CDS:2 [Entrophospora sp. SA101]|nr:10706_t:CDS:2 [Entrophospora sp. SA101]